MATLYISEYAEVARSADWGSTIPAPQEPSHAEQQLAIGAGSVPSAAFNARTRLIRVHTDAVCFIAIGPNPVASTVTKRMAANATEIFGVTPNHKIAVIVGT